MLFYYVVPSYCPANHIPHLLRIPVKFWLYCESVTKTLVLTHLSLIYNTHNFLVPNLVAPGIESHSSIRINLLNNFHMI